VPWGGATTFLQRCGPGIEEEQVHQKGVKKKVAFKGKSQRWGEKGVMTVAPSPAGQILKK